MAEDTKVYLPKQKVTSGRGVAGYRGEDIVVVDPETGTQESAEEDARATKRAVSTAKKAAEDDKR